jgi:hypothetical protein
MPAAGDELFSTRPSPTAHNCSPRIDNSYAPTHQKYHMAADFARTSNVRYMWRTNHTARHNSKALYFDAASAPHYRKYLNGLCNLHACNCKFCWIPDTDRAEEYTLQDIHLSKELSPDYCVSSATRDTTDLPHGTRPDKSRPITTAPLFLVRQTRP